MNYFARMRKQIGIQKLSKLGATVIGSITTSIGRFHAIVFGALRCRFGAAMMGMKNHLGHGKNYKIELVKISLISNYIVPLLMRLLLPVNNVQTR